MKLNWTKTFLLVVLLASCLVDAQKRRKDKKKEGETKAEVNPEEKAEVRPETGSRRAGKTTTSTTTTTTPAAITDAIVEEDTDDELSAIDPPRSAGNMCPPELKPQEGRAAACTCRDELDDNALMVECVALTDAQQMQAVFGTLLLGKRIDALEVRNSTIGALVPHLTAQAYIGTILMRGNGITDLVPDAFQGSEQYIGRMDLGSNQLARVNFSMFDTFTQLQVLNLGENQLTSIENAGQAPSLRVLYLYSNQIDAISPRAFKQLQALEYLDLRWNNLQVLAPAAFHVTSSRWQLRIRSNQIASFEDVFAEDSMPYLMDLSLNNVGTLTDVVYGPLIESALLEGSKLYIAGNPIQCDCSLAWLLKNTRLLAAVVGARCDGDGIPITDLNLDEFRKCPPPKPWNSPLDRALAELARESE